jgi:hypothetical protein
MKVILATELDHIIIVDVILAKLIIVVIAGTFF